MGDLLQTYRRLEPILGESIESFDSVQLVESYRQFMKPDRVKTVLLAESHVFTSDEDRAIVVPPIPELPGYPTQYARFVYCLAYGERRLTNNPIHPKRDGTPQFWKIFYSCLNSIANADEFQPVLGRTPFDQRLSNKISVLKAMKSQGVWLVDASVVGLYHNGSKAPGMFRALKQSWKSYTRDVVMAANPQNVICIGKGVDSVVGNELRAAFGSRYQVIEQPNAFLKSDQHLANFRRYRDLCLSGQNGLLLAI